MTGGDAIPLARTCLGTQVDRGVAQMDFIRHMAPELLLALFLVCMSGALVAAAYITSR
jgi:hypothetical protein